MTPENPHYLLFSEASQDRCAVQTWRFVLQHVESQRRFSATDSEPSEAGQEAGHERLELLAVVRGLEALDRPARVTLVTKSRYVSRGIKHGLSEWRSSDWRWERFGRVVPVRDHDLWRRVDRALRFHRVDCQAWQFDDSPGDLSVTEQPPMCRSEPAELPRPAKLRNRRRRPTVPRRSPGSPARSNWATRWSEALSTIARPMRHTSGVTG